MKEKATLGWAGWGLIKGVFSKERSAVEEGWRLLAGEQVDRREGVRSHDVPSSLS